MRDRAIRRDIDKKVIKKRLKFLKLHDDRKPDSAGTTYYEKIKAEPNRLAKKHPYDCGNSKCYLCHANKLLKNKKAKDRRMDDIVDNLKIEPLL